MRGTADKDLVKGVGIQGEEKLVMSSLKKEYHGRLLVRIFILLLFFVLVGSFSVMVQGRAMEFSTRVIAPENQVGEFAGFFDVKMEPGEEQILEIELTNLTEEPLTLLLEIATATTDDGGIVFYRPQMGRSPLPSLIFPMEEIAEVAPKVEIEPLGVALVPIVVSMPEEEFDGILAGGISVTREMDLEAERAEAEGMIINRFFTEIAIILRQNENVVEPDLHFGDVSVGRRHGDVFVFVNLRNPEAAFIHGMELSVSLTPVGETREAMEEILEQLDVGLREELEQSDVELGEELEQFGVVRFPVWENMQVAPNSYFNFGIPLEGQPLVAGDYLLKMEIDSLNGSWSFEGEVSLSEGDVRGLVLPGGEGSAECEGDAEGFELLPIPLWLYVVVGVGIVVILLSLYFGVFREKVGSVDDEGECEEREEVVDEGECGEGEEVADEGECEGGEEVVDEDEK